jgi:hypothetical protein
LRVVEIELDLETGDGVAQRLTAAGADALVFTPLRAVSVESVVAASRSLRIRSLTADPGAVEAGVAVGLGLRDDRPEILVNRAAAAAEGADFDSRLLAAARMVP